MFSAIYMNVGAEGWGVLNGQWAEADYGLANGDGVSTGDNMVGYFVEFTPGSIADVNDNAPELARSVSSVIVTKAIAPAVAARPSQGWMRKQMDRNTGTQGISRMAMGPALMRKARI